MIRITKQTDYGVVLLSLLAADPEHQYNASELADRSQLPGPMVSKILKQLSREGLLNSQRGAGGGYSLARRAETITVAEIVRALEGPIAVTECLEDEPGSCDKESFCHVRGNWTRINQAIRGALEGVSLAEMSQPAQPKLVTLGSS